MAFCRLTKILFNHTAKDHSDKSSNESKRSKFWIFITFILIFQFIYKFIICK